MDADADNMRNITSMYDMLTIEVAERGANDHHQTSNLDTRSWSPWV